MGRVPNRLADATSPYLLQHADNPVDWWEWGDEAFAEARRRRVPVLLSVGYAACHWCHEASLSCITLAPSLVTQWQPICCNSDPWAPVCQEPVE